MTDQHPSDEVVSAYLDGEATPEEVAAVEASAPARARADELDVLRALVGEPVVPPAGARDAAVAAALDVHDRASAPVDLAARRARRRPRRALAPILGAVASVVFVMAVAAIALQQTRSSTQYSSAGAAADSSAEQEASLTGTVPSGVAATGGAPAPAAPAARPEAGVPSRNQADQATAARTAVPDLGVIADATALRRAVSPAGDAPALATGASAAVVPDELRPCDAALRAADPGLGPLVLAGRARHQDAPAGVLAYQAAPDAPVRAYLVRPGTCQVLLVDPA